MKKPKKKIEENKLAKEAEAEAKTKAHREVFDAIAETVGIACRELADGFSALRKVYLQGYKDFLTVLGKRYPGDAQTVNQYHKEIKPGVIKTSGLTDGTVRGYFHELRRGQSSLDKWGKEIHVDPLPCQSQKNHASKRKHASKKSKTTITVGDARFLLPGKDVIAGVVTGTSDPVTVVELKKDKSDNLVDLFKGWLTGRHADIIRPAMIEAIETTEKIMKA